MRIIKFKFYDKYDKTLLAIGDVFNLYQGFARENIIISQYTGLKDKNGKEIYEGDVVQWSARDTDGSIMKELYEVSFKDGAFRVKELRTKIVEVIDKWCTKNGKIIGNIYENPELLTDTKV